MIKATSDRFADDQGNLDLEWMSNEAERLMKTWEVERQTEKRLTRETPMQRSRRIKREQTQMSAAELKERRELEKEAQKKIDRRKRVVERLDDKTGIDAETGEPVKIEEEVHERTDQIRWKTGHLAPRAYAEGPPVRPPGSPPEAAKRKAAKMRASRQHPRGVRWSYWRAGRGDGASLWRIGRRLATPVGVWDTDRDGRPARVRGQSHRRRLGAAGLPRR